MTTSVSLIIYSICFWIFIPSVIYFIHKKHKKRNPSSKSLKSSLLSPPIRIIEDYDEDEEDEEDPRSLSQLQVEGQHLLSSRRKAVLLRQNLERSLQVEKSPESIALTLVLKTCRFKVQKITLLKNRLAMNEIDMQHLNAELQRIEAILASMQTEKKSAKQAKQAQKQEEEKGITPQHALFNKNFLASLKEAFAKRTPHELGVGIRPEDNIEDLLLVEELDNLTYGKEEKILNAEENEFPSDEEILDEEILNDLISEINSKRLR